MVIFICISVTEQLDNIQNVAALRSQVWHLTRIGVTQSYKIFSPRDSVSMSLTPVIQQNNPYPPPGAECTIY